MNSRWIANRSATLLAWIVAVVALAPGAPAMAVDHGGTVSPDPVDASISIVDGEVLTLTEVGGKVIAGGNFTQVGPGMLGAAGVVDLGSGAFVDGFADVDGVVTTVAADGAGGWYLGGEFTSVGGQPRVNAAHVDASGALTGWDPAPNGRVESIVVSPGGVVIGGSFTSAGGVTSTNLALVDAVSGQAVPGWDPVVSGPVFEVLLSTDSSRLYVGGDFLKVDGVSRKRLAAVDAATGELDATFVPGAPNLAVRTLAERNGTLYVGGDFTSVAGVARRRVAAVEAATGVLVATDPGINGRVEDIALSADGSTLFVVGAFGTVAGQTRSLVAGLSAATLEPTSLAVAGIYGTVDAVAVLDAGRIVIGGTFHIVPKKGNPQKLATVSTSTGAVSALVTPSATPASLTRPARAATGVQSLAISEGRLAVGGDFSDYGVITRPYLVAMDATTGALDREFAPAPDQPVLAVEGSTDGNSVYVGGEFIHLGGSTATRIAKLDLETGQPVPGFSASANAAVRSLVPVGDRVFLGGSFTSVTGMARSNFGAVDATTGAADPTVDLPITSPTGRSEDGGVRGMAVTSDGSRLMLVYNAAKIGGLSRQGVAQVDLTTNPVSISAWSTTLYDYQCKSTVPRPLMRDIAISPDDSYAVVVTSGDNFPPGCDTAVAFPVATAGAVQPIWVNKMRDTLESVAISESAVYVGGHFRWADDGAVNRFQVAALSPTDGRALSWNPSADGFRGVVELKVTPHGLLLGSDGDTAGGEPHGRFALFPAPAPNATPTAAFSTSCTWLGCTFDGSASTDPDGAVSSYNWDFGDGTTGEGAVAQHTFAKAGQFTVRLRAADANGGTDAAYETVVVAPEPQPIAFRKAIGTTGNKTSFSLTVPAAVQQGDALLLFASVNNSTSTVSKPAGLTGWKELGIVDTGGLRTFVWWKTAATGDASRTVTVNLSAIAKVDLTLAAYDGTDPVAPIAAWQSRAETSSRRGHTTPSVESTVDGAWVISYWADKSSATTEWTAPAGDVVRRAGLTSGSGRVTSLFTDDAKVHAPGTVGGKVATADAASAKATAWTVVLRPAG